MRFRTWVGAITIGSFLVMAITGILLFFHIQAGMIKLAHEWLSWVFVIAVGLHVVVNWKAFLGYFRTPLGRGIILGFVLVGALSFLPIGGSRHRPPFIEMMEILEQSPLHLVAQVFQNDPSTLIQQLKNEGIEVQAPTQTIAEIASQNQRPGMEIFGYLLKQRNPASRKEPSQ